MKERSWFYSHCVRIWRLIDIWLFIDYLEDFLVFRKWKIFDTWNIHSRKKTDIPIILKIYFWNQQTGKFSHKKKINNLNQNIFLYTQEWKLTTDWQLDRLFNNLYQKLTKCIHDVFFLIKYALIWNQLIYHLVIFTQKSDRKRYEKYSFIRK